MTVNGASEPPQDLSGWLFRDTEAASKKAAKALAEPLKGSSSTVLAKLGHIARASLGRQIVNGLKELLPGGLVDVFRAAWGDYEALLAASAATVRKPGAERVVAMKDQKVRFEQEPTFDIVLDGTTLLTVKGDLEVEVTLVDSVAIVRGGRLTDIHAGHASVSGVVQVEGLDIAKEEYVWPFNCEIAFDPGLDLTAVPSVEHLVFGTDDRRTVAGAPESAASDEDSAESAA